LSVRVPGQDATDVILSPDLIGTKDLSIGRSKNCGDSPLSRLKASGLLRMTAGPSGVEFDFPAASGGSSPASQGRKMARTGDEVDGSTTRPSTLKVL